MNDKEKLLELIKQIHRDCFQLCKNAFGKYLPIAGNIGIFCQSQSDFEKFTQVREEVTKSSDNPNQKYFELKEPIVIPAFDDFPEATYTHLYIRKPAEDTPQVGDIDFILEKEDFEKLKHEILNGKTMDGASVYERPGWDMIELKNPEINSLAYVSYKEMAEKARIKFD